MARPVLSACSRWTSHPVAKSKERNSDLVTSPKHTRYTLTHRPLKTLKDFETRTEHTTGVLISRLKKSDPINFCVWLCV